MSKQAACPIDDEPPCPRCKTDLLVDRRSGTADGWVCHGCEQTFELGDVPASLRRETDRTEVNDGR